MSKIDKDLLEALKKAKSKKMYFALVEKTPGEGTLIRLVYDYERTTHHRHAPPTAPPLRTGR